MADQKLKQWTIKILLNHLSHQKKPSFLNPSLALVITINMLFIVHCCCPTAVGYE